MIIETIENQVTGMDSLDTRNIIINEGSEGMLFDMLFKDLYKDPIYAIVRELCSNAQDSHREAGVIENFKVQLPGQFDNNFIVTDHGKGMSHDTVMELYRRALYSDKRETNDLTGGLGAGSKSFYSYTDSAKLVSDFNGERRRYLCGRNKINGPTITALPGVEKCEGNGFSVSIPVHDKDWRLFAAAFKRVQLGYIHSDIQPETTSGEFPIEEQGKLYPKFGDIEGFFSNGELSNWSGSFLIRQGSCVYPAGNLMHGVDMKFSSGMIDFPIGTLRFTPSRDEILDNESNREAVKSVAQRITQQIENRIHTIMKDDDFCYANYSDKVYGNLVSKFIRQTHSGFLQDIGINTAYELADLTRAERIYVAYPDAKCQNVRFETAKSEEWNSRLINLKNQVADKGQCLKLLYKLVGKDRIYDIMDVEYVRPIISRNKTVSNNGDLPVYNRNWVRLNKLPEDYVWFEVDKIRQGNSVVYGRDKSAGFSTDRAEQYFNLAERLGGGMPAMLYVNSTNAKMLDPEKNFFRVTSELWKSEEYRKGFLPRRLLAENAKDYGLSLGAANEVIGRMSMFATSTNCSAHSTTYVPYDTSVLDPRDKVSRRIAQKELDRLIARYPKLFESYVDTGEMMKYYVEGQKKAKVSV